jgi:hypothetical protein
MPPAPKPFSDLPRPVRLELLQLAIELASRNGFNFENWWQQQLQLPWGGVESSLEMLTDDRRYYSLLFSHGFASCFWKQGTRAAFTIPSSTYTRRDKDGNLIAVKRKAYIRRTLKADAWVYHLREMAATEEPLRYIRRFLLVPAEQPVPVAKKRPHRLRL